MRLTVRALNRATLARQLLLEREPLDPASAVRRVVALQAQHPASPYVALWNRVCGFDPVDLDAAFTAGSVVRSTLMRVTLHAVHADDHLPFREAMEPTLRSSRLHDARFGASGLTPSDADAIVPGLLDFAREPRTGAECEAWLADQPPAHTGRGAWWALRQYAPLWHVPTGGPWSFGTKASYRAPRHRPGLLDPDVTADGLRTLVRRYLEGFGPASVADMGRFALVHRARLVAAVDALGDALVRLEGPDGSVLFDVPGAPLPTEDTPAPPRLLGMWDSVLLAYADRSRIIPAEHRRTVMQVNGDALPTLLVDGRVAGLWRAIEDGIEVTAFHPLADEVWAGIQHEAAALRAFLSDRDACVYKRYHHWWAKLPTGEVRLLGG